MKKFFTYLVSISVLFLILGIFLTTQNETNKISKLIKDNTPASIKYFLKSTVFYIPLKIREFKETKKINNDLKEKNSKLIIENNILKNEALQGSYKKNEKNNYLFQSFIVPFISENDPFKRKSKAYLEVFKDKVLIIFWSGKIIYLDKNNFDSEKSNFIKIKNNISKKNFFNNSIKWSGIRDALVVKNKLSINSNKFFVLNIFIPVKKIVKGIKNAIIPIDWKKISETKLPLEPSKFSILVFSGKIKFGSSGE